MTELTLSVAEMSPTKVQPAGIYVYHDLRDGISLGLELKEDGTVTGALAVCAPRDSFSRPRAQFILRARLQASKTERSGLTFDIGTYNGSEFKNDVFTPLHKYVRDNAYLYLVRKGDGLLYGNQKVLLQNFIEKLQDIKNQPESNFS